MHYSQLLTTGNPKVAKGISAGYFPAILHLAPVKRAGRGNVCPWCSKGCAAACLNTAGRGGIFKTGEYTNAIQLCRIARTQWYFDNRPEFMANLARAITTHVKRAARKDLTPCIRLNGTSDIEWERETLSCDGKGMWNIFEEYPAVQFYDYTKGYDRMRSYLDGALPSNYYLTFSRSESNELASRAILKFGGNVALVFTGSVEIVQQWYGARVIDGDKTDLRFLDDQGVIVGLKAKGQARHDRSGFVINAAGRAV